MLRADAVLLEGAYARPLPQHLAVRLTAQRHVERQLGLVLQRFFVLIERHRPNPELADGAGEQAVALGRILQHRQGAALIELALEGEGERLFETFLARQIVEFPDADAVDVAGDDRLRAGEAIPARERRTEQRQQQQIYATMFTRRPGTTMTLRGARPSRMRTTPSLSSAKRSIRLRIGIARHSDRRRGACRSPARRARSSRSSQSVGSCARPGGARDQLARRRGAPTAPRRGAARTAPGRAGTRRRSARGSVALPVASLTKIIICAIAVLKRSASVSSSTFLIVACRARSSAGSDSARRVA